MLWLIIGSGVLVLLVAAIKSRNHQSCQGYEIDIVGGGEQWFIDKKEIVQILSGNGAYALKGRALNLFDLRKLEEKLENNVWIQDAELFFDNNEVLQVKIVEREPVARIFTAGGNSFYIDSMGERLPLSEKLSARVPVFTGYPSEKPKFQKEDSALVRQVREVSKYVLRDPFWMAQIAQVDITPDKKFEMIPTIGNHVIEFGNGNDYEKKFKRLFQFYRQVLSKTGMNRYERINVQFSRQVIGIKGNATHRVDSLQAARNVTALIAANQSAQQQQATQGPGAVPLKTVTDAAATTAAVANAPVRSPDTEKPPIRSSVRSRTSNSSNRNPPLKSQASSRQPRAVMGPRRGG